jgi:CBS domain-containing protein
MTIVAQVLGEKGHTVWSVEPQATVYQALELMAGKGIGAVLVREGEKIVGILSERDYARKVELQGKTARTTRVSEIMTPAVYYIQPHQTIEECMALMTAKRIRHLPVLEQGRLVGIISIGDVVKALIADKEFMIQTLEKYITDSR